MSDCKINTENLISVLCKMLDAPVIRADFQANQLHGGTVGDVILVTGTAEMSDAEAIPFNVVFKSTKKWERHGDPDSWRREYDLYSSNLGEFFLDSLRWPKCYHMEVTDDEAQLWLEYINGISGLDMTGEMYEHAAEELGRFQGRLFAEQSAELQNISNLGVANAMEEFYLHYKSWDVVHDYVRSDNCEIPNHLCKMIIDADEKSDETFRLIERLPLVFCHRDFWVTNIFYCNGKIILIDWDTAGWGYLGEDIVSLIADEADVDHMVEYYRKCVPAYCRGFSEYVDISHIKDIYIRERIILHFGYRLIEWYLDAETPEDKQLHLDTLQKVYEMGDANV